MVETIYEITKSAENISGRGNSIILNGLSSDIPTVITGDDASKSVAWPSIYKKNNDGSTDEVYMGATNLNTDLFPEYDFVEEVYDILVAKTKSLAQVPWSALEEPACLRAVFCIGLQSPLVSDVRQ